MRKSVYCLLSKLPFISAVSGDRINELNIYRALSVNYDVYYNNRKLNFNDTINFGTNPRDRVSPPNKKYDFYYVRNNPLLFGKLPHPKFYFCVPNHQGCYKQADGIIFPTRSWKDKVAKREFDKLACIYKKGDYVPKNLLEFSQITYPEDVSKHPTTLKYRKIFGGGFIIGHWGRVIKSNSINLPALASWLDVNIVYGGGRVVKSKKIRRASRIKWNVAKYAISACDMLMYNQNLQGHFAGSLKIIDAMSYGVPITTPRYDARVDELGEEYPLYVEHINGKVQLDSLIEKINWLRNTPNDIKGYLFERAKYYNLENSAIRYREQIEKII